MSSPAQRYAAFRQQQAQDGPELTRFQALYDFSFDEFQRRACQALNEGHGVLVAAPTGSGKTVVGEFAVHLALAERRKCFYTTPIKALSNQKYGDLVRRYGAGRVGLLTGDNSINGEAPVVVMTTEVLRNMLYGGSATLAGLSYVVLDEVHYLADAFRGAVWEEVIIHLPESVRVVALSATVSNAEEFGDWLTQVRGGTTVIVDEHRPVPLWQHVLAGALLYDLFVEESAVTGPGRRGQADGERAAQVNPELLRLARREQWAPPGGFATETLALGINVPARTVVIERLDKWNGEAHLALTPGEYTQLTGRAGRRGIDVEGHAVVLWHPGMDPAAVAGLAGTRTYPLNSSFRPSYNMAVNLVGQVGLERAAAMLESSFAQFQADRAVVDIARRARRSREALAEEAVSCDRGDFAEYARLRKELSELEGAAARQRSAARRAEALRSLQTLRRGDIIRIPGGRRSGIAVVLDPGLSAASEKAVRGKPG